MNGMNWGCDTKLQANQINRLGNEVWKLTYDQWDSPRIPEGVSTRLPARVKWHEPESKLEVPSKQSEIYPPDQGVKTPHLILLVMWGSRSYELFAAMTDIDIRASPR